MSTAAPSTATKMRKNPNTYLQTNGESKCSYLHTKQWNEKESKCEKELSIEA